MFVKFRQNRSGLDWRGCGTKWFTHRVSVSVFADNVEQVADGPYHDARLAAVSHHRVGFATARRPVSEYGGVETD